MACWFEYNGKRYEPDELVGVLKAMPPVEAAKYIPGIKPVPEAPFQKSWHELALKDAIHEAASKGLDRISWTPGEAQAARYDLSRQVEKIGWAKRSDGTYDLSIHPKGRDRGSEAINYDKKTPEELSSIIGKEAAENIVNSPGERVQISGYHSAGDLVGPDLKVGGEGMKGFYDKIIPDALNKIGKPHGVKVEKGELPVVTTKSRKSLGMTDEQIAQANLNVKGKGHPVHYMDIPQSLKDQALKKGFSLFEDSAATGAPLAALEGGRGPVAPEPQGGYSASRGTIHEPAAAAAVEPAAAPGPGEMGPGGGGPAGGRSLGEAQATAARWAGERQPLEGIPGPLKIGDDHFVPGPIGKIHDVAEDYMRTHRPEIAYAPPTKYHPIDPEHSKAIAQAYEEMKHAPEDAATKAAYDALIDETAKQYEAIKKSGLKIEPIPAGAADPYAKNPRLAAIDVAENNHLWFFPTEGGFGSLNKKATKNAILEYDRRIQFLNDPERNRGAMYRAALEADPQHILSYDDAFRQQTPYVQERVGPEMEASVKRQVDAITRALERGTYANHPAFQGPGWRRSGDRPLLPGVRAGLEGKLELLERTGADSFKGAEIYKRMGLPAKNETEGSVRSAQRLREMGIPAMKYRDASSRGLDASAGPTHNYVVFDDNMLRILRRYGVVGIPAAGVMAAGDGDSMRERKAGGSVNSAMDVARSIKRAKGGKVHLGPIVGHTDGRADKVPMEVPDGSYVLTADHCSAMGEGNTLAGFKKLKAMFPKSVVAYKEAAARGPTKRESGGRVPILAADGEFVICPEDIKDRWGDLDKGHRILDHWQTTERKNHIKTLASLAPPAQD